MVLGGLSQEDLEKVDKVVKHRSPILLPANDARKRPYVVSVADHNKDYLLLYEVL